jgi:hypothetical protein
LRVVGKRKMCENTTRDGICMFDWSSNLEASLYSERGATGTDWPGPICDMVLNIHVYYISYYATQSDKTISRRSKDSLCWRAREDRSKRRFCTS